jgi:tetratricopeptide (TPR) repeat protein
MARVVVGKPAAPAAAVPPAPSGYHAIADSAWPSGAEAARAHHAAGLAAASRRDAPAAVGEFLASWDAFQHAATARNAGRAYEEKGDLRRALTWYERAADRAPEAVKSIASDIARVHRALAVAEGAGSR